MAAVDLGPAELITLVFPGERAHPGVAAVLAELAAGRDIRVLDLVFVTRTSGDMVRITGARENLDDIGLGALQLSTPELIREDDLGVIRDWLRPGASAAVVAYEHSWARRLAQAVRDAGGMVMLGRTGRGAEERQAIAESEAAVREAEAEAAAAERAADRYSALGSRPADDDLVSRLAGLARLRESGALSAAEFEAAKARLLAS
jgi:Family of unknown function (DUF6325)/Short C-terminal domain